MAKSDTTLLVNPDASTNVTAAPAPLQWQSRRIGITFPKNVTASLQALQKIMNQINKVLTTIEKTTKTILQPIIALLRAIEDPFSAFIKQILDEVDKLLQAFQGQGLYILDYITPFLVDKSTTGSLSVGSEIQAYYRNFNTSLLIARSQKIGGGFDADRLADSGMQVDANGNVVPIPGSNRATQTQLTPGEINQVAQAADQYQQAFVWIQSFHDDLESLFDQIETRYSSMEKGAMSLGFTPGTPIYAHYVGDSQITKSDPNNTSAQPQKVYFSLNTPLSQLVDPVARQKFLANLLTAGGNGVVWGTPGGVTGQVNYLTSTVVQDPQIPATVASNLNQAATQKALSLTAMAQTMQQIIAAAESADPVSADSTVKSKIYNIIETQLKAKGGTSVTSNIQASPNSVAGYSEQLNPFYLQAIQFQTAAPIATVAADAKNAISTLFFDNGQKRTPQDIANLTTSDLVPTVFGFRYDVDAVQAIQASLVDVRNQEVQSFQTVINFLNTEVEFQGNTNQHAQLPHRGIPSPSPFRPPIVTAGTGSESSSSSTNTQANNQAYQNALTIVAEVTQQLNVVDAQKTITSQLRSRYKELMIAWMTTMRQTFSQLDLALTGLSNAARLATQANSNPTNQVFGNDVQVQFNLVIQSIISIKNSFAPFFINQYFALQNKSQTQEANSQQAIEFETTMLDIFIGDHDFTPFTIITAYLKSFVDVFTPGVFDAISSLPHFKKNPFVLYQSGFTAPNTNLALNDRIDLLAAFSNILDLFSNAGVDPPGVFFNTAGSGQGVVAITYSLIKKINEMNTQLETKLGNQRRKILSDLEAANESLTCAKTGTNVSIPSAIKAKLQDQQKQIQSQIDTAISRRTSFQTQLTSLIGQIPSAIGDTPQQALLVQINVAVEQVGGFLYKIDQTIDQKDPVNRLVPNQNKPVPGKINTDLIGLNFQLNTLKGSSIQQDYNALDQFSDNQFKTKLAQNLAIISEQIQEVTIRIGAAKNPGQKQQFQQQLELLKSQQTSFLALQNNVTGNMSSAQVDILNNLLDLKQVAQQAITSVNQIITDLQGAPITQSGLAIVLGTGLPPKPPVPFNINGNYRVNDNSVFVSKAQIIQLFTNQGLSQADAVVLLNSDINLAVDADVVQIIDYSVTSIPDSNPTQLVFSLQYLNRLFEFNAIDKKLGNLIATPPQQSANLRNDSGGTRISRNWIIPQSKNSWIASLISTFRDQGDLRRPVFIDDVSTAKPLNAALGPKLGPEWQGNLDRAEAMGEMAVVIMAAVSTDLEKVYQDVHNLYNLICNPGATVTKINAYKQKFEQVFGNLAVNQLLQNSAEFFSMPSKEDVFDKIRAAFQFQKTQSSCPGSAATVSTKPTRVDRWLSLNLGDIYIIADIFDGVRRVLDMIRHLYIPKLGLADLLQSLLDFIENKIAILKRMIAGIGLILNLLEFLISLNFSVNMLTVRKVRSVAQLERELKQATNWPSQYLAPTDNDPLYILSVVFCMPDSFFPKFNTLFKDQPSATPATFDSSAALDNQQAMADGANATFAPADPKSQLDAATAAFQRTLTL